MGLLAILMITLAPTISHVLAAYPSGAQPPGAPCDMAGMQPVTRHVPPAQHASPGDGDDCGYCSLLAHFPFLASAAVAPVMSAALHYAPTLVPREAVRAARLFAVAQPRAPPAFPD